MSDRTKMVCCFVAGTVVGVLSCWSYFKNKYEKRSDEEIELMREYYTERENETPEPQTSNVIHIVDSSVETSLIEGMPTRDPSTVIKYGSLFQEKEIVLTPYIISADEFYDEDVDFEKLTLQYYTKDRILADDDDHMVEDVEDAIGNEWEQRFGEFVRDAVYVRNPARKADFEIVRVLGSFTGEPE